MASKKDPDFFSLFFEHGIDVEGRTIWCGSSNEDSDGIEHGVNHAMAQKVVKGLYILERLAPQGDKPIKVIINTPGGDEYDGYAMIDAIKSCKNHVTTIALGKAFSMGAYILQAGDERVIAPNCTLMFHAGSGNSVEGHPEVMRRWINFECDVLKPRLDKILLDRIKEKKPEMKDRKFHEMNDFDAIMTAEQAIEWGLADRILEDGELFI